MMGTILRVTSLMVSSLLFWGSLSIAADQKPRKSGPKDKCPVCGMFVVKYPDFVAQIQFRDGTASWFDGTKDMFKFYLNMSRYAPGKKTTDVAAVFVTSYYDLSLVDGLTACYVIGSDVYGPMGRELIPFTRETEARDFMKDHHGKAMIRFRDVTPAILKTLD
jgi:copper chaperone NosL